MQLGKIMELAKIMAGKSVDSDLRAARLTLSPHNQSPFLRAQMYMNLSGAPFTTNFKNAVRLFSKLCTGERNIQNLHKTRYYEDLMPTICKTNLVP